MPSEMSRLELTASGTLSEKQTLGNNYNQIKMNRELKSHRVEVIVIRWKSMRYEVWILYSYI